MQTTMADPRPSWDQAKERYHTFQLKHDLSEKYVREERRVIEDCHRRLSQVLRPHLISEDEVLTLFQGLKAQGLAPKTQAQYASALRGFLGYLGAPAARWIPSFPTGTSGNEGRYLEDEERDLLWKVGCATPEDEMLLVLGLGAGWRRGDAVRARLEDFQPSAEAATSVIMHGKGEKFQRREIELHPRVSACLSRYLVYRTALVARSLHTRFGQSDPGTLFLAFSWHKGLNSMGLTAYNDRLAAIYARAGVDPGGWPSHNLRRTWADNRLDGLTRHYEAKGTPAAMALELALRQVCFEGRWKDEKTLRQSYLKRRLAPTSEAWALTKV